MTDYKNLKRFEKSQINGLTKHLSNLRFKRPFNTIVSINDVIYSRIRELDLSIEYNDFHVSGEKFHFVTPRKITKEQTQFGKNWLKSYFYKLDGSPRSGKRTQYIDGQVLKIANKVMRFEFIGVFGGFNGYGELMNFIPIYRAYDKKGNYFDYAPIHWCEPLVSNATMKENL